MLHDFICFSKQSFNLTILSETLNIRPVLVATMFPVANMNTCINHVHYDTYWWHVTLLLMQCISWLCILYVQTFSDSKLASVVLVN